MESKQNNTVLFASTTPLPLLGRSTITMSSAVDVDIVHASMDVVRNIMFGNMSTCLFLGREKNHLQNLVLVGSSSSFLSSSRLLLSSLIISRLLTSILLTYSGVVSSSWPRSLSASIRIPGSMNRPCASDAFIGLSRLPPSRILGILDHRRQLRAVRRDRPGGMVGGGGRRRRRRRRTDLVRSVIFESIAKFDESHNRDWEFEGDEMN